MISASVLVLDAREEDLGSAERTTSEARPDIRLAVRAVDEGVLVGRARTQLVRKHECQASETRMLPRLSLLRNGLGAPRRHRPSSLATKSPPETRDADRERCSGGRAVGMKHSHAALPTHPALETQLAVLRESAGRCRRRKDAHRWCRCRFHVGDLVLRASPVAWGSAAGRTHFRVGSTVLWRVRKLPQEEALSLLGAGVIAPPDPPVALDELGRLLRHERVALADECDDDASSLEDRGQAAAAHMPANHLDIPVGRKRDLLPGTCYPGCLENLLIR